MGFCFSSDNELFRISNCSFLRISSNLSISPSVFSASIFPLLIKEFNIPEKFKGYKYLTKRVRRQMYVDLEIVVKKFQDEMTADAFTVDSVKETFKLQGLNFPTGDEQKVLYLYQIMQFMFPGKYYKYIKTASFGKLLRNPENQMMEGDCNQIVTFYIYL